MSAQASGTMSSAKPPMRSIPPSTDSETMMEKQQTRETQQSEIPQEVANLLEQLQSGELSFQSFKANLLSLTEGYGTGSMLFALSA